MTDEFAQATPIRLDTPDLYYRLQAKDQDGKAVDLTLATALVIVFQPPDFPASAEVAETAVVSTKTGQTDPVDGWLEFKDGDPATKSVTVGEWKYWARVTIGADGPFPSNPLKYTVSEEGDDS